MSRLNQIDQELHLSDVESILRIDDLVDAP
jgi:hypothetical protein